jgi:hypothetical protein
LSLLPLPPLLPLSPPTSPRRRRFANWTAGIIFASQRGIKLAAATFSGFIEYDGLAICSRNDFLAAGVAIKGSMQR